MSLKLNSEKALIFRITHQDNLPWILQNGLHCRNSQIVDPNFVTIGNPELIDKRQYRLVDIPPGGTLSDYIPFYFTPFSPMLYNVKTGWGGIKQRPNHDIVILVSSLHKLRELERTFVFSDRHAYLQTAQFSSDLKDLERIDWRILQTRDFRRDTDDMGKIERYQAEALVHQNVPTDSLLGIVCYDKDVLQKLETLAIEHGVRMKVITRPQWYF